MLRCADPASLTPRPSPASLTTLSCPLRFLPGLPGPQAAPRLECAARLLRVAACKAAGMAVAEGAAGAAGGKAKAPTKAQKARWVG